MSIKPEFNFFIDNVNTPVCPESSIWQNYLPENRNTLKQQNNTGDNRNITYGDYFKAASGFFEEDTFTALLNTFATRLQKHIKYNDINEIDIFLVKHGAFYHPARVEINLRSVKLQFALTAAVSLLGKTTLSREYNILQKLNNNFQFSFLPEVYQHKEVSIPGTNQKAGFLIGEWLEDFNEFHLSRNQDNQKKIIVWDSENGNYYLSNKEGLELYTQAAAILTCYYNIETFEQIFPWHHAAGDFVVKKKGAKLDLKLITVRQYASMLEPITSSSYNIQDSDYVLEGLLIFFLNLSIRMRLDRLDGVGDIALAEDFALAGTLQGCLHGLRLKSENNIFPEPLDKCFKDLLSACTQNNILDLLINIVNTYDPRSSEVSIIKQNLNKHAEVLYDLISKISDNDSNTLNLCRKQAK